MIEYLLVGNVKVDSRILTTYFSCDYEKCKGACCWVTLPKVSLEGGGLTYDEAKEIRDKKISISPYCSSKYSPMVNRKPVHISGSSYYTTLHKDGSCLFSNQEKRTCALRLAHSDGKLSFPIPLHCSLYPIDMTMDGKTVCLTFMNIFEDYCAPAFEKGKTEKVLLFEFCKDSLIRAFGEEFYRCLELLKR